MGNGLDDLSLLNGLNSEPSLYWFAFNPLKPDSDSNKVSPFKIHTKLMRHILRIYHMITGNEFA